MPFDGDDDGRRAINARFEFDEEYWKDVSNEAKDLISKLLVGNINSRLNLQTKQAIYILSPKLHVYIK